MSAELAASAAESVRVYCRVRPATARQETPGCVRVKGDSVQVSTDGSTEVGHFARVFGVNSTQEECYAAVAAPLIDGLFEGRNAAIIGYGQTGSGKTHTLFGPSHDERVRWDDPDVGLIPRMCADLFARVGALNAGGAVEVTIKASFLEIYLENVLDLLAPERQDCHTVDALLDAQRRRPLKILQDAGGCLLVCGAVQQHVASMADTRTLLAQGLRARASAATRSNAYSSRSHAIFLLTIAANRYNQFGVTSYHSQLYLCDLAGSEKQEKTAALGGRLREACKINFGLLALANVIAALTRASAASQAQRAAPPLFVPYRDSKLTRMLKNAFGGNGRTALICTIHPCEVDVCETLSTLRFGIRCQQIQNVVLQNVVQRTAAELEALLSSALQDLAARDAVIDDLRAQLLQWTINDNQFKAVQTAVPRTLIVEIAGQPTVADCGVSACDRGEASADDERSPPPTDIRRRRTGLPALPSATIDFAAFCCPLTRTLLFDPVVCNNGTTYERYAIEQYLANHGGCAPGGAEPLPASALVPNQALKRLLLQMFPPSDGATFSFAPPPPPAARLLSPLAAGGDLVRVVIDDFNEAAMHLPMELLLIISESLGAVDLISCVQVCQQWSRLRFVEPLWQKKLVARFGSQALYFSPGPTSLFQSSFARFWHFMVAEIKALRDKMKGQTVRCDNAKRCPQLPHLRRALPHTPAQAGQHRTSSVLTPSATGILLVPTRPATHFDLSMRRL